MPPLPNATATISPDDVNADNVALDVAAGGSVLSPNMDGPSCAIRKRRRGDYDGTVAVQAVSFATFEEFLDWSGTRI
jgi:hypothetical protein